ncbi:MAG: hypothetical protein GY854_32090 [Deltaproteobacteria bacterium]|nr:hypothetical protein [Deltaproteobacteria bacterium]
MNRTTIMLPPELKIRAVEEAGRRGISLGELVRQSLEGQLIRAEQEKGVQDPLFAETELFCEPTPRDLADNHDDYLYGDDR